MSQTAPRDPPRRLVAVGLAASFLLAGFLFTVLLYAGVTGRLFGDAPPDIVASAAIQAGCSLLAFGVLTWAVGLRAARLSPADLRWVPGGGRGFPKGLGFGALPALVIMVLGVLTAGAAWSADGGTATEWFSNLTGLLALLGPAALAEEVIFRGLPLVILARALGRWPAVVGLAILFGAAHLFNPDITVIGLVNIVLAGVFLGLVFYLPGGLWTATGAHLGWNLTLASLAAPVSGLPLPMPGLDYAPGGPLWLTGGPFGPEGGVLATGVLLAAIGVVARVLAKEAQA